MNEILRNKQERTIYSKDGVTIKMHIFPNMLFCSFVEYEDEYLCYSIEVTCLAFELMKGIKTLNAEDLMNIDDKKIIDYILKNHSRYKSRYNQGVEEDSPETAFIFCQKRDYAKQYYKAFYSNKFSDKALYKYAKKLYCLSEDGYGYELLGTFLEVLKLRLFAYVTKEVCEKLKDNIQKDGTIEIYRGFNKYSREDGISYTLSYDVAQFFAKRWDSQEVGYVNKYKVKIKDIIAYIDSEQEIITKNAMLIEEDI